MEFNEKKIKVKLLVDITSKKKELFEELYNITLNQQTVIEHKDADMDLFEEFIEEKDNKIKKVNDIDEQFDNIYREINEEIKKEEYKKLIKKMQENIREINDLAVKIQVVEEKNKKKVQENLLTMKTKMKKIRKNKNITDKYKKLTKDQSYFVDKKN